MTQRVLIALETAAQPGGAALIGDDGRVLAEEIQDAASRHGRGLFPAVTACLERAGRGMDDVAGVIVDAGPGSYTGLRVGVMSAKALAFGRGVPVVAVASLDAIAWGARATGGTLAVCMDARQDEVYFAVYALSADGAVRHGAIRAISPDEAIAALHALPEGARCVGSGCVRIGLERLRAECPGRMVDETATPAPAAVAELGWRAWRENPAGVDVLALQPSYPRREGVEMQVLGEGYQAPAGR